jgi:transposase
MKKKYLFFVGIDISAATLDVVYGRNAYDFKHQQFLNNAKGINQLITLIIRLHSVQQEVLICCEHTGVYMDKLAYALKATSIDLWAVHPLLMSNYSIDLNRFKSDKADAKKIFLYAINNNNRAQPYQPISTDAQTLKDLFSLRKQLITDKNVWECRLKGLDHKALPNQYQYSTYVQMIQTIKIYIKQTDDALMCLIKQSPSVQQMYSILISIPGIGPVIAQHMLFLTDCFTKFSSWKAFANFIGTAPHAKQSGTTLKKRARTSKQAHRKIKADLNQGVVSICTKNKKFKWIYQQLFQQKIPHLQIVNNIKNALLKLAFTLVNKKTEFNEEIFFRNKLSWQNCLDLS